MLKKVLSAAMVTALIFSFGAVQAQSRSAGTGYKTGLGMHLDLGEGSLYGFSAKYFLSQQLAGQATLLFGRGVNASIGAELQYHIPIAGATGLKWYAGGGLQTLFLKGTGDVSVWLRPMGGLDYKVSNAPFNISFDWRPTFVIVEGGGSDIGRFGLGFRYTL